MYRNGCLKVTGFCWPQSPRTSVGLLVSAAWEGTTQRTRSVFGIVCLSLLAIHWWQQSFSWSPTQCKLVLINICSKCNWIVIAPDCLAGGAKGEGNGGDSPLPLNNRSAHTRRELPAKQVGDHAGKLTKLLIAIIGFIIEKHKWWPVDAQGRSTPWCSRAWKWHLDHEHCPGLCPMTGCRVPSLVHEVRFLFGREAVWCAWVPPHEWNFENTPT